MTWLSDQAAWARLLKAGDALRRLARRVKGDEGPPCLPADVGDLLVRLHTDGSKKRRGRAVVAGEGTPGDLSLPLHGPCLAPQLSI